MATGESIGRKQPDWIRGCSAIKDAYYFSHDANARHDPKILAMRSVYGYEGYGWYWALIEMMREQSDYKLCVDGKYAYHAIAMQLQCEADAAQQFICDCADEFALFEMADGYVWSNSLLRRMEEKDTKSAKASKAAKSRWDRARGGIETDEQDAADANAMQTHSERNASKVKESKRKESKEKESKDINHNQDNQARAELIKFVEQELAIMLSPVAVDKINAWLEEYDWEVIKLAIGEAVVHNKRSIAYVDAVLGNWGKRQLKTAAQVQAAIAEFENEKKNKQVSAARASVGRPMQNFKGADRDLSGLVE